MKVKDVVVMKEVADDLNDGKDFYEQRESGIGEYFWDSLFADIESLVIYAGVHVRVDGLYRMLSKRFPYAVYYEIVDEIAYVIAVLPMVAILHGLTESFKKGADSSSEIHHIVPS